jgi:predicted nucleotidyltransferase
MEYRPLSIIYITEKVTNVFEEYGVIKAAVFGSCAKGEMHRGSDVDILVDFMDIISGLTFIDLKIKLENILKRKVDLISYNSLNYSEMKNEILLSAKVIYEKRH